MTSESEVRRYRDDANKLRSDVARASSVVAAKRKKSADASIAASKSRSDSTIRMKLAEAQRATKEANDAEKKRADLEKKLADVEVKAGRAQERLERDRQVKQDRAMSDLRRRTEQAASQFGAPRRLGDAFVSSPAGRSTPVRDVFLSHASEDKDEVARPLQVALETRGISVWFDEIQIRVGQSIRREIERGIAACRFGVVVVSPHFFAKQWTNAELDALFDKKMESGQDLVLPVWHRVSKDEVMRQSPLLAGILALNSATMTIEEMADALAEAVGW